MKKFITLSVVLLFLYLIVFPDQALASARDGLILWYQSVVPVLFPFMLTSNLLIRTGILDSVPGWLFSPIRLLFGCSKNGTFAVITGFLCGFPMGAKITSDLYQAKKISREEANYLFGFVNNLSPGFILSFIAYSQLNHPEYGLILLGNILGASLLYGLVTGFLHRPNHFRFISSVFSASGDTSVKDATSSSRSDSAATGFFAAIDTCIYDSVQNTLRLGGYIVLFCILSDAALGALPANNVPPVLLFLVSCIEVTNGVRLLASSTLPLPQKILLLQALGAFGGLSAAAQTAGICHMERRQFFQYIKSRVIITLLSITLAFLLKI